MRRDLSSSFEAVGTLEPRAHMSRVKAVLLRSHRLDDVRGEHRAELSASLIGQAESQTGEESCPESIPHPGRIRHRILLGAPDLDDRLPIPLDPRTLIPESRDPAVHSISNFLCTPTSFLFGQRRLVLIREQVCRPVDESTNLRSVHPSQLLGRIGREGVPTLPAFIGVTQHPLRIIGTDDDQIDAPEPVVDGEQFNIPGLAHRTGVERSDLIRVLIRGANEPCRLMHLGDMNAVGVYTMTLQPGAVVGEVRPDGTDEHRLQSQHPHAEGDVRRDASAPDLEGIHKKGQGDPIELVRDQRVGKPTREGHEVISGDGSGDDDIHPPDPTGDTWSTLRSPTALIRVCQWNESPQAQDPVALGLSIVKPCFSMVSTKSMIAPFR